MAVNQGMVLINTVYHNKSNCSERDYNKDLLARKLQYKIALLSHIHLIKIVENKVQMLNFALNWDHIRGTEKIWEGNVGCTKV